MADAVLGAVDLQGADLRGANLDAYLGGANLHGARYDQRTIWDDSFDPLAAGAVLVE